MFIFATIMLLLSILWFSLVMIREPRTLWSGASFLFLLLQSAIWLMAVLFMNSERIMANRLMMLLLTLALLVVMVLIAVFPVAFIGVFFWEGIKNIRREGLRPANALSLLFAAGLVIYTLVWPLFMTQIRDVWVFALSVILSLAVMWLLGIFAVFCFSALLNLVHVKKNRGLDQVVVLGSGLMGDQLTPLLKSRVDRGIQVMDRNPGSLLILSGGQGSGEELPEGQAMAAYALEQGVDPERIRVEDKSLNTEQNLLYSSQLFAGPATAVV
ncbi:YdcF family protein, partial [uncultured Faecalibaculum sp.]